MDLKIRILKISISPRNIAYSKIFFLENACLD